MKKKDLIDKLNAIPDDADVYILDWMKNNEEDNGEGTGAGIYDFYVEFFGRDMVTEDSDVFISLTFDREDD